MPRSSPTNCAVKKPTKKIQLEIKQIGPVMTLNEKAGIQLYAVLQGWGQGWFTGCQDIPTY